MCRVLVLMPLPFAVHLPWQMHDGVRGLECDNLPKGQTLAPEKVPKSTSMYLAG